MQPVIYRGILHDFTFSMHDGKPVASVREKSTSKLLPPLNFFLPDIREKKPLPPMEQISCMLGNGYYPLIRGQTVTFHQGLRGGMKKTTTVSQAEIPPSSPQVQWDGKKIGSISLTGMSSVYFKFIQLENGTIVTTDDQKNEMSLWDPTSGDRIKIFKGYSERVTTLFQLRDGTLASGSGYMVNLWNPESGKLLVSFMAGKMETYMEKISLLNDDTMLIIVSSIVKKLTKPVTAALFPDAFMGLEQSGAQLKELDAGQIDYKTGGFQLKNGTLVLTSLTSKGDIILWNPIKNKLVKELKEHTDKVTSLILLRNGFFASASLDRTIKIWDNTKFKCIHTLEGTLVGVTYLLELRNNKIASGTLNGNIKFWDPTTYINLSALHAHTDEITVMIELGDGTLASGSKDSTVKLWNLNSSTCLHTIQDYLHQSQILELKDGSLAIPSKKTLRIWKPGAQVTNGSTATNITETNTTTTTTVKASAASANALQQASQSSTTTSTITLASLSDLPPPPSWLLPTPTDSTALMSKIEELRAELATYNLRLDANRNYVQETNSWLDGLETYYRKRPDSPKLAESLKELQAHQDHLRTLSSAIQAVDPTATLELTLQQKLDQFAGIAEETFRTMQLQYEQNGREFFAKLLQEQRLALEANLEFQQTEIANDLSTQQKDLYQQALKRALQEQSASLNSMSEAQLQKLQHSLNQNIGLQLEKQIQDVMSGQQYQRQMQELQRTLLDQINRRQTQIIQEVIHTQKEQADLKDKQSTLYKAYETKQRRLQEQQQLQNPPSVQQFYNRTEKQLSSKLMSAMMLVSGLIKREELGVEAGSKMATTVIGSLCSGIPIVGNVVGSLVTLGMDQAVEATVDHVQKKKYNNAFDSAVSFKDAMALAELAARRTTQSYLEKIQTLTTQEAAKAGENAADVMYDYLQSGKLKALAHHSLEQKMEALVKEVHIAGEIQSGLLKKTGGIFTQPTAAQTLTPAAHKQVHVVTQDIQGVKGQIELHAAQTQITIQTLQKEVQQLKAKSSSSLISAISTGEEQAIALQELKNKGSFTEQFKIQRTKKDVIISPIGSANPDNLKKLVTLLSSTFDQSIIDDCEIENGTIIVTGRNSVCAQDLEGILTKWLVEKK